MQKYSIAAALLLAACQPQSAPESAATECNIPAKLDLPTHADRPDRKPDPPASGYTLALSWSPEFCRFRADVPKHAGQCRDNDFTFIVHGLWVQGPRGDHPRACALAPPIGAEIAARHYCMMPSVDLMQHEWAAHGTCGFDSAADYFATTAKLWTALVRPDLRTLDPKGLDASDIRTAFTSRNPDLPRDAIYIDRKNNGWLREVRLCLDLDLAYATCEDGLGAGDDTPILLWRGG